MEREKMKMNTIKCSQWITKRKKRFFALVLGVILATIPATTVMAFDLNIFDNADPQYLNQLNVYPGDKIVWTMDGASFEAGRLSVVYHDTDDHIYESGNIDPRDHRDHPFDYTIERGNIEDFHHWKVDSAGHIEGDGPWVVSFNLNPVLTTAGRPVTVTAEPEGAGQPASKRDFVFSDDRGSYFDIMANPAAGYDFVRWESLNDNASIEDNSGRDTTSEKDTVFKYSGSGEVSIKAIYQKKTDSSDKDDDKKGKDNDKKKKKGESSSSGPVVFNPDAICAYYLLNGAMKDDARIGKQKQGPLAESLFMGAIPAGWKAAFSMSMSVNGKNEYSLKNGYIVLYVPAQYQKTGRQFAFLAMDENGKVYVLDDLDPDAGIVKVNPNIKGYAYYLIYKD